MKPSLYIALLLRLRADASAAISKLLRLRNTDAQPVAGVEIEVFVYPGPVTEPMRWCARVAGRPGTWLCGYAGEPVTSETEALCSLIERAHVEMEGEGGSGLPFHLIDQLEADRDALTVYRREVPRMLDAAKLASAALDEVAELG